MNLKEWNTDQGVHSEEGSKDGYDKLKPFNRRILWLEVASSNNDPKIVAQYYLDCVRQLGATARIILGDRGTAMVNVAAIQRFFRRSSEDDFSGE